MKKKQKKKITKLIRPYTSKVTVYLLSMIFYYLILSIIVASVNKGIKIRTQTSGMIPFSIGILDIYGFEIFDNNGFEQFW